MTVVAAQPEMASYAIPEPYTSSCELYVTDNLEKLNITDRQGGRSTENSDHDTMYTMYPHNNHNVREGSYQATTDKYDEESGTRRQNGDNKGPRFHKSNRGRGRTGRYNDGQEGSHDMHGNLPGSYNSTPNMNQPYQPSNGTFYSPPGSNTTTVYTTIPGMPGYPNSSGGMMHNSRHVTFNQQIHGVFPGGGYFPPTPPSPGNPGQGFFYSPQYTSNICSGMNGYVIPPVNCPPPMQPMM